MDILIAGVGGQGTILASKILAKCAVISGKNARTGETIGMSQRGGCVVSHVRTGEASSPYIPQRSADVLLAFELCEGARGIAQLKPQGKALVNTAEIMPVAAAIGKAEYNACKMREYIEQNCGEAVFVDADGIAQSCGSVKAVNIVMLGAAARLGWLDMDREMLADVIIQSVAPKFREMNMAAFEAGEKYIEESMRR